MKVGNFNYKTGQILLVHSNSKLAKIIQNMQMRKDEEAGYWNHSGIIFVDTSGVYVVEMAEVEGFKFKSATVFTPIEEYLKGSRELLILDPKVKVDPKKFNKILLKYIGISYDYKNLVRDQIFRLLFGWWLGRNQKKAWKRMVCHEFVQFIWNLFVDGLFPNWNKADVTEKYRSTYFNHVKIKK